jgi:hypothetical protein
VCVGKLDALFGKAVQIQKPHFDFLHGAIRGRMGQT